MKLIDTHCHITEKKYFEEEIDVIINEAKLSGVEYLFDVGYDLESSKKVYNNAIENNNIFGLIGIHPDEINIKTINDDLKEIKKLASSNKKIIGIGEIGLDYYHMTCDKETQKKYFIQQLKIAQNLDLPVSIHVRDKKDNFNAYEDCYNIILKSGIRKGVMHSFCGTYQIAEKFIKLGFYISISGIVTFKNAPITHELVQKIDINKLLVETDSPYLTPDPYRGAKNYPKYITYIAKKIASLKSLTYLVVVTTTSQNTKTLFNIK